MADDGSWFPAVPDEVMAKALRQHASNAQEAPLLVPTQIWLGDHEPLSEPTKIDPVAMVDQWFSDTFPGSVVGTMRWFAAPALILNPLIDVVEQAMAPSPAMATLSLGSPAMVLHTYISGKVETDEGVLGDQAIAIVPLEILCV